MNTDPVLAEIMKSCWEGDPKRRPNFEFVHRRLRERFVALQNEVGSFFPPSFSGVFLWEMSERMSE